jgi:predicted TPR repeat methyltransferase
VILDAVPAGCGAAVDVGCGDGLLACRLAARCAAVTGIDRDKAAARLLPGARYRRHLLWRYSLLWTKPA